MASAVPEDNELPESAWELSKENVKPVKSGRNVSCIQAVLQPSDEDIIRLNKEKCRFEEEILAGENPDDPIDPWSRYLEWTIQNFPTGRNDKTLGEFLRKFVDKFNDKNNYNDIRYVKAWLKLAEILDDALEMYSYMNTEGIGKMCADFYISWAEEYERCGDSKKANRIYTDGLSKNAQPCDLLQKRHTDFQLRLANNILKSSSGLDYNPRSVFDQLEGKGKHHVVGSLRAGKAFKPLQNQDPINPSIQCQHFQIYEDSSDAVTVRGEAGKWTSAPSTAASKENLIDPGPWNAGMNSKPKPSRQTVAPVQSNFDIYEDDGNNVLQASCQPVTMTKSVLCERKDVDLNFSQIKSVIHEMPVQDDRSKSFYDTDKVYTVMGEMQFEEVRAVFWRKRQRIIDQQRLEMKKRQHEELKARLVQEEMQTLELERRLMEAEWMKRRQRKLDLENRLKEIKVLGKMAKTPQEIEVLNKEQEDITIKLQVINSARFQDPKPTSMDLEVDRISTDTGQFCLLKKNSNDDEVQTYTNTAFSKDMQSGNNSLNHSKRSQPSPTANTKEAMKYFSSFFTKSLDDDGDDSAFAGADGVNPPSLPGNLIPEKANADGENNVPFQIFDENSQNAQALPKNNASKRGLSTRSCEPAKIGAAGGDPNSNDFKIYSEDKTDMFDEATVAGDYFATKAHMASTPATSKSNLLQESRRIGNLSSIPPCPDLQKSAFCNFEIYEEKPKDQNDDQCLGSVEEYQEPGLEKSGLTTIKEASKEFDSSSNTSLKSSASKTEAINPMDESHMEQHNNNSEDYKMDRIEAREPVLEKAELAPIEEASREFDSTSNSTQKSYANRTDSTSPMGDGHSEEQNNNDKGYKIDQAQAYDSISPDLNENGESSFLFWGDESKEAVSIESPKKKEIAKQPPKNDYPCPVPATATLPDPWDESVQLSIMRKYNFFDNSDLPVTACQGATPFKLKPDTFVELDVKYKIGKLIGEGAFAKVHMLISQDKKDLALKSQTPSCPWEVYATIAAKNRLLERGMADVAERIVTINSAYFFDDCSLLVLPHFRGGTILDTVNKQKKGVIKNEVAVWMAYEIMKIVHGLHSVGIIHGDIKPDNLMIVNDAAHGIQIKLIDFGRAIDMTEFPENAIFDRDCGTSGFQCVQMQTKQPWNYHIDHYGIAGTMYVVLFGAYMKVSQSNEGSWKICGKLRRWHNGPQWHAFFDALINHPTPTKTHNVHVEHSPLPDLLNRFKNSDNVEYINSLVEAFFRCLDLAANQAFLGVVGSRLIAKLAANISTSHTLSSSNTYLLLVPTVAPSNLEQSKRQVVGNLVSSNDKTSQHRIVGVLDEEEEKQNILRRKVPSTVEGTRPSNSRIGSNLSLQRQKQISGHCSVHSGKTISSAGKDHSAIHKQPRQHCSSPTDISILTDNLQQLVSASERGYAIGNKQHQTNASSHQVALQMPPPLPHHQQDDTNKTADQSQDMVGWAKMDEQALVKDFDANLSGLGLELGAGAYNMSEVLNLPIFKQDDGMGHCGSNSNIPPLQYMLQAPTSPASKVHEETLTYLNQGQSYEIKLKKMQDLTVPGPSKLVRSTLRVVFHDRRLQYMEHQQLEGWKFNRPGDRLVNIDVPMSVGIMQPRQPQNLLNLVEFLWDPHKETSVYIQVHCISTEFTPKKHGGERGVPFRIQIDTYSSDGGGEYTEHIHSASCQIKVFKPKGADRKQKTDKDKMEKRSAQEQLKYKPSYNSTLLTESTAAPKTHYEEPIPQSLEHKRQSYTETSIDASVDVELQPQSVNEYNVMEDESPHSAQINRSPGSASYDMLMQPVSVQSQQLDIMQPYFNPSQASQWLQRNRFVAFAKAFNSFSGSDLLTLSREDLVQICGPAEGIRLHNSLRAKKNQTRLTVYMTPSSNREGGNQIQIYHAVFLELLTANELIKEALSLFEQGNGSRLFVTRALYQPAKSNIHVLVTDELVGRFKDEQHFTVILIKNEGGEGYQIILKQ